MSQVPCQYCSTPFLVRRAWQKFCCERCRKAAFELQAAKDAVRTYLQQIGRKGAAVTNAKRKAAG